MFVSVFKYTVLKLFASYNLTTEIERCIEESVGYENCSTKESSQAALRFIKMWHTEIQPRLLGNGGGLSSPCREEENVMLSSEVKK